MFWSYEVTDLFLQGFWMGSILIPHFTQEAIWGKEKNKKQSNNANHLPCFPLIALVFLSFHVTFHSASLFWSSQVIASLVPPPPPISSGGAGVRPGLFFIILSVTG
jgi:hypothetical protein